MFLPSLAPPKKEGVSRANAFGRRTKLVNVLASAGDVSCPALARQLQHFLHDVILGADRIGVVVAVLVRFHGAEQPGAAVAGLAAEVAGPGRVQVDFRIARAFRELMPHDSRGSISAGIHVGAAALTLVAEDGAGFAAARALVGIAHHRIMDDFAGHDRRRRTMVSAELGAEARIRHVLIGQDEIDSIGVVGQVLVLDGVVDDGLNVAVSVKALPQRIVVVVIVLGRVVHGIQDVLAGAIAIGGVNFFLSRATQMAEIVVDNPFVFGAPVAVPDDVNRGSFLKNGSAVVVDVAGIAVAICQRVWRLVIGPQRVGSIVLGESRAGKAHRDHKA